MITFFETDRLILRSWHSEDLPLFIAMNKDPRVMRYFPAILSDTETESFYKRIQDEFNRRGWGLYAVELKATGEFIGYVGLHEIGFEASFTPGVEIGWRLASAHHGRGYATEAARAILHLAAAHGLSRLYSFTTLTNTPSERVMQKLGMTRLGEFDHPLFPDSSPLRRHFLYGIHL